MHTITCILPTSRENNLELMADQFRQLDLQNINLQILLIIDNMQITRRHINETYQDLNPRIVYTEQNPPGETDIYARRKHITDNLNLARQQPYNTDLIWLLEDDTIYPPDTLQTLLKHKTNGITSGLQAGRHGIRMLGAWTITPTSYTTIPYNPNIIEQQVDATGLYCCLIDTQTFLNTPFRYQPELPVGPDVLYGQDLKHLKHIILPQLKLGHQTSQGIIYPDENCQQISFTWNKEWETQIL